MWLIFGIIVLLAILGCLVMYFAFLMFVIISFMAFMAGGYISMAIFGDGQGAFFIGGALSAIMAWGVLGMIGNKTEKK